LIRELPLAFEAEATSFHQVGRRDGDGWSVRVGDPPQQYLQFGPYTTDVAAGKRQATWRLMVDDNRSNDTRLLTLDVYDAASKRILATQDVTRKMFQAPMKYQEFSLNFEATPGQKLEVRTYWHGGAYVRLDRTTVTKINQLKDQFAKQINETLKQAQR
jgi:hypothetical protein